VYRTPAVLHVETEGMTLIGRDSRAINLTQEPNHLKDVLITLMCQHHTHVVQSFAKILHWHPVSGNLNLGAGPMDPRGHISSAILASPCSTALVAVRLDSVNGPRVFVKRTMPVPKDKAIVVKGVNVKKETTTIDTIDDDDDDDDCTMRLFDREWDILNGDYEECNWAKIEGQNFMSKMEMLLGCLTKTNFGRPSSEKS